MRYWSRHVNTDFTLKDCLFGSVKLIKNADPDKYKYSGSGITFNSRSESSLPEGSIGKNVIIFDNTKKDILIRDKGPTQG